MPPPALLLHGFLGRGADWEPVAARLAATRPALAPDWLDDAEKAPVGNDSRFEGETGRGDGITRHGDSITRLGNSIARRGDDTTRRGDDTTRRGDDTTRRGDGIARRGGGDADDRDDDAEPFDVATPRPGGLAHAADGLAACLDTAGVDRADVAGYSMGGRLALLFALRHPARVQRLVLVSASPGLRTAAERAARRDRDAALARDLVADFPAFLHRWTRQPVFASLGDAQRDRIAADRLAHVRPETAARALVGMGTGAMPSLWEPLRALRVETHAIAGALDPTYVAIATSSDLVAAGVRGHVLPGAGHNLLAEAPAALADLLDFLLA